MGLRPIQVDENRGQVQCPPPFLYVEERRGTGEVLTALDMSRP